MLRLARTLTFLVLIWLTPCHVFSQSLETANGEVGKLQDAVKSETNGARVADGLYLINRWTNEKKDLLPLLDEEILVEHDPKELESDSTDAMVYATVQSGKSVLFAKLRSVDPIEQSDGRINLNITLSPDSATALENLSRLHLGRRVATVIGGKVVTLHKIRSIIKDGKLQITRCTDDGCKVILQNLTKERK